MQLKLISKTKKPDTLGNMSVQLKHNLQKPAISPKFSSISASRVVFFIIKKVITFSAPYEIDTPFVFYIPGKERNHAWSFISLTLLSHMIEHIFS